MNAVAPSHEIVLLTPDAFLAEFWRYEGLLVQAAAADRYGSAVDLARCVAAGTMQFWLVTRDAIPLGCWLTEIKEYSKGRALVIQGLAGKHFMTWRHLRWMLYDFARETGCVRVLTVGRRGLERFVPEMRETRRFYEVML